ncbi:MAG TPA: hypothetical protein DCP75_05560 [Haliea salexigens]|uniref:O-antigen ligase domain-containing protein n=1 Tax=Haliea salexigens TaxID=287487 RepID=A0A3C1KKF7_9GAMM|nr:hypothetical protein [Haliea sp.]HAN27177.1 hypothetical protein [Haliea salexigens]
MILGNTVVSGFTGRSFRAFTSLSVVLFGGGVILAPVYLWSSGGMQLSHVLFGLFSLITLLPFVARLRVPARDFMSRVLLVFVLYVWAREAVAFIESRSLSVFIVPLHFTFVLLLFYASRLYLSSYEKLLLLSRVLTLSVVLSLVGVLLGGVGFTVGAGTGRALGFFNNPNQLGYYAVCAASIFTVLRCAGVVSVRRFLVMLAVLVFLAVLSLSKAAILSILVIPVLYGLDGFGNTLVRFLSPRFTVSTVGLALGIAFSTVMLVLLTVWIPTLELPNLNDFLVVDRLANFRAEGDSSLAVRGYGLIFQASPAEQLFGTSSLTAAIRHDGHEVHSTLMAPLTYYGLFGGGMFVIFFAAWWAGLRERVGLLWAALFFLPVFLFGITHNGSRFSLFWILVAASSSSVVAVHAHTKAPLEDRLG